MITIYELPRLEVRTKIIDVLLSLPNIADGPAQKALLATASLDSSLANQIPVNIPLRQFIDTLVAITVNYGQLQDGRYALVAILEAAKEYFGQDKQAYCDQLIKTFQVLQQADTFYEELNTLVGKVTDLASNRFEVAITVPGTLQALTEDRKMTTLNVIAAALGVPFDAIRIYGLNTGSIVFELGIPFESADFHDVVEQLQGRLHGHDNLLFRELDITRIVFRRKDYLQRLFPELQKTYQAVRAEHQVILFESKLQTFRFETVLVNVRGEIIKKEHHTAQQYIEDLGNGATLELVAIPGGTFLMGSPETEEGSKDLERPQHRVTLSPFYMGKYPVTQAQWEAVMGTNPSYFKGANRPVECVTWDNVQEFLRTLNAKIGKEVYRLPTEAEWEYACRAGTTTPFAYGATITPDLANYDGNYPYGSAPKGKYREETTDVGSFPPNAFGMYDMHGNVWEWCQDWYGSYSEEAVTDPRGPESGSYRVIRGSGWSSTAGSCRAACRRYDAPAARIYDFGFRLVRTPA
jgi:formylglycine-generating enzyme required for sulfatase activity